MYKGKKSSTVCDEIQENVHESIQGPRSLEMPGTWSDEDCHHWHDTTL